MQKYKFLPHTADAFFEAYGNTYSELLVNSAEAMCSVMYGFEEVKAEKEIEVNIEGKNKEELLHNFLEAVLFEISTKEMLFKEFEIKEFDEEKEILKCVLKGEEIDSARHELKSEIKAVTWHQFFVKQEGNKWVSQVLVDI